MGMQTVVEEVLHLHRTYTTSKVSFYSSEVAIMAPFLENFRDFNFDDYRFGTRCSLGP